MAFNSILIVVGLLGGIIVAQDASDGVVFKPSRKDSTLDAFGNSSLSFSRLFSAQDYLGGRLFARDQTCEYPVPCEGNEWCCPAGSNCVSANNDTHQDVAYSSTCSARLSSTAAPTVLNAEKTTSAVLTRPRHAEVRFALKLALCVAVIMFVPGAQPVMSGEGKIVARSLTQVARMLMDYIDYDDIYTDIYNIYDFCFHVDCYTGVYKHQDFYFDIDVYTDIYKDPAFYYHFGGY
ncbi:hypothetical protein TSTA_113260 [Talaromyces stipitatus ATCC 10500]|uniref:Uncharacterized protein n=1 Tax=Talaromyces stipitatus (strain ATCC 10500 / CBS 375.48 / QM 6759 / NRRL 1006) TaxID=441959 RepID=B8MCX4_TALSN|nr:uncharacterized protein TSTA_113260 [Talaromyces stipitatus ATCC 10500]EED17500.1 hypothetical protein TSTA_113260 [Talaromyces stipitatus ATCC 10500]